MTPTQPSPRSSGWSQPLAVASAGLLPPEILTDLAVQLTVVVHTAAGRGW